MLGLEQSDVQDRLEWNMELIGKTNDPSMETTDIKPFTIYMYIYRLL